MLSIEHRIVKCGRSLELVHDALVRTVPALDPALVKMLTLEAVLLAAA
jgi:hypothetical protein